jgi:phosphoinositide-3-kinase regulatory subunit 4
VERETRTAWANDGGERKEPTVTEAMDVFSAGCVIAEVFLEGASLFSLSQLFKYREGEYSVEAQLSAIGDEGIRVSADQCQSSMKAYMSMSSVI